MTPPEAVPICEGILRSISKDLRWPTFVPYTSKPFFDTDSGFYSHEEAFFFILPSVSPIHLYFYLSGDSEVRGVHFQVIEGEKNCLWETMFLSDPVLMTSRIRSKNYRSTENFFKKYGSDRIETLSIYFEKKEVICPLESRSAHEIAIMFSSP